MSAQVAARAHTDCAASHRVTSLSVLLQVSSSLRWAASSSSGTWGLWGPGKHASSMHPHFDRNEQHCRAAGLRRACAGSTIGHADEHTGVRAAAGFAWIRET